MSGGWGGKCQVGGGVPHLSGVSLSRLSNCVGPFCLDTHDESQFSLPLRIRFLEANQSPSLVLGSLPICLRWFSPRIRMVEALGNQGFRCSQSPCLWPKSGGGMLCKAEEQRTAPGGAGPPRKADFPHLTLSPWQTPHIPRLKRTCSAFVRFLFFYFLFSWFFSRICWLCAAGSLAQLLPVEPWAASLSGTPDLKPWVILGARVRFESGGIRSQGFRHQVSVMFHEGNEEAGGWGPGLLGLRAQEYSSRLQRVGGVWCLERRGTPLGALECRSREAEGHFPTSGKC